MSAPGLPRRVLAIGAHPDDLELSCAGTLARFVQEGSSVHLAVACRGDRGGEGGGLAELRRGEATRAAELLGVPIEFLEFGDADVWDTPENRARFVRLLRLARPELVITHAPNDYHDDHVRIGELVSKCTWFAASSGHDTGQAPLDAPPALMYMDNVAGIGFEPTHLVDITATIELKRRMLACHASQLQRREGAFPPLDELAESLSRHRGFQCGVAYAEGFRPALLWGRRRPEPLLP